MSLFAYWSFLLLFFPLNHKYIKWIKIFSYLLSFLTRNLITNENKRFFFVFFYILLKKLLKIIYWNLYICEIWCFLSIYIYRERNKTFFKRVRKSIKPLYIISKSKNKILEKIASILRGLFLIYIYIYFFIKSTYISQM